MSWKIMAPPPTSQLIELEYMEFYWLERSEQSYQPQSRFWCIVHSIVGSVKRHENLNLYYIKSINS
jgi:hypothetical protein